jgi:uncharacterized RDD family membrane protein YckC
MADQGSTQPPVVPAAQPPTPGPVPGAAGPSGPRAGFWRRFGAALIDGVILSVVLQVIALIFGGNMYRTEHTGGTTSVHVGASGLLFLLDIAIAVAYFGYLEGSPSGQTIGKRVLGIRVIDFSNGGPIGRARAVGRYFARWLSGIACFLGYLWMLWDKEKQTWHDKLTTSVVVPTDSYPVAKWPG